MYHGDVVPGFPQHPHRGFETVTIVRKGYIDHSDSLGAAARFGMGDVQWLTAGAGIVHSEMFPLLERHGPNPLELFQIWLNLPAKNKMAAPYFTMFWDKDIPRASHAMRGSQRRSRVIAGALDGCAAAGAAAAFVGGARRTPTWRSGRSRWSPARRGRCRRRASAAPTKPSRRCTSSRGTSRCKGVGRRRVIDGPSDDSACSRISRCPLEAVNGPVEILLLQGRPIGEPVAQHGPFVMNTRAELRAGVRRLSAHPLRRLAVARRMRRCTRARRAASRSTPTGASRKCSVRLQPGPRRERVVSKASAGLSRRMADGTPHRGRRCACYQLLQTNASL